MLSTEINLLETFSKYWQCFKTASGRMTLFDAPRQLGTFQTIREYFFLRQDSPITFEIKLWITSNEKCAGQSDTAIIWAKSVKLLFGGSSKNIVVGWGLPCSLSDLIRIWPFDLMVLVFETCLWLAPRAHLHCFSMRHAFRPEVAYIVLHLAGHTQLFWPTSEVFCGDCSWRLGRVETCGMTSVGVT